MSEVIITATTIIVSCHHLILQIVGVVGEEHLCNQYCVTGTMLLAFRPCPSFFLGLLGFLLPVCCPISAGGFLALTLTPGLPPFHYLLIPRSLAPLHLPPLSSLPAPSPSPCRCSQIMGRTEQDELSAAQIFYPCMQCADIFFLKVTYFSMT